MTIVSGASINSISFDHPEMSLQIDCSNKFNSLDIKTFSFALQDIY